MWDIGRLALSYMPIHESLHVYLNGVARHPDGDEATSYVRETHASGAETVKVFTAQPGDRLEARYAYEPGSLLLPPPTTEEVIQIDVPGHWADMHNYPEIRSKEPDRRLLNGPNDSICELVRCPPLDHEGWIELALYHPDGSTSTFDPYYYVPMVEDSDPGFGIRGWQITNPNGSTPIPNKFTHRITAAKGINVSVELYSLAAQNSSGRYWHRGRTDGTLT